MKNHQETNVKIPFISKLAYGFGDIGCNFSWMFVGNFLMIFYTDVCGIPMAAVSLLMLISRFWDAINDPKGVTVWVQILLKVNFANP